MKRISSLLCIVSLAVLCVGVAGCSSSSDDDDLDGMVGPCPPGAEPMESVQYRIPVDFEVDLDNDKLYRISSREVFDGLFGDCEGLEEIDFGRYQLLFIKGEVSNGIKELACGLFSSEDYYYFVNVTMDLSDTAELTLWNCALLIEGLEKEKISLYINSSGHGDWYAIDL